MSGNFVPRGDPGAPRGTNFPVIDKLLRSYDTVADAHAEIICAMSHNEQVALFSENAEKVFGLTEA